MSDTDGDDSFVQLPSDASNEVVRLQDGKSDEHRASSRARCSTCAGRDFSVGIGVKWYGLLLAVVIIGPAFISRSSAGWLSDILYFSLPVVILGGMALGLSRLFRLFPLGCEACRTPATQRLLRNSAYLLVLIGSLLLGGMFLLAWWSTGPIPVKLTVPLDAEEVERSEDFWDVGPERLPHLYFENADSPDSFREAVSDSKDDIDVSLLPTVDLQVNEATLAVRFLPWDSLGTQDEVEASLEPNEVAFACSWSSDGVRCVPPEPYSPSKSAQTLHLRPFQNNGVRVSVRDIRKEYHGSKLTVQMAVPPESRAVLVIPLISVSSFLTWLLLLVAGYIWWAIVDSWLVRQNGTQYGERDG